MYFIITVDTEADNQWSRPSGEDVENIKFLPRFNKLCASFGFPSTYLITYEVASDQESVDILKGFQAGGAEIGSHMHPWTTPPFDRSLDEERMIHRFPHELATNEFKIKLKYLTEIITKNFGSPVSFRSGRWGFDRKLVEELIDQGYLVDCSETPKISWKNTPGDPKKEGGPDFRRALLAPHYYDKLLEVPLTVIATGPVKEGSWLVNFYNSLSDGFFKKVINKLFIRVKTFRIFPETNDNDLKAIVESAFRNNLPVIEFMIHSSELMPGGSKYAKDQNDVERTYKRLEKLFTFLKDKKVEGITLKDYYLKHTKKSD